MVTSNPLLTYSIFPINVYQMLWIKKIILEKEFIYLSIIFLNLE